MNLSVSQRQTRPWPDQQSMTALCDPVLRDGVNALGVSAAPLFENPSHVARAGSGSESPYTNGGDPMIPDHVNPMQWHQAQGIARQSCARLFRDGGSPEDAMRAFELDEVAPRLTDWDKAVDAIAHKLCAAPLRRAA